MIEVQEWLNETRDRAKQECNIKAYSKFFEDCNQAERGKRAKKRHKRDCLTENWTCDELSRMTLLVTAEDGIGDGRMPLRPDFRKRSITWKCNRKLKMLFTRSFPSVAFASDADPQCIADGTVYSWELIRRFRANLRAFPWLKSDSKSYLKPSLHHKDRLAAGYRDHSSKILGLAWRSERKGEVLSDKTCDIRNVPHWAEFFARLKPKVRIVSLQYGDTEDDIAFARWKYGVEIYQDESIDSFNDVDAAAAQIAAMDYVASISTTTAHLAGALGVPGWVLLQAKPYMHWRAGETICP